MIKEIEVKVEQKHIKKGKIKSCTACPIALALKDAGAPNPRAFKYTFSWSFDHSLPSRVNRFTLPKVAMDFVRDFDKGEKVYPFIFRAEIEV